MEGCALLQVRYSRQGYGQKRNRDQHRFDAELKPAASWLEGHSLILRASKGSATLMGLLAGKGD